MLAYYGFAGGTSGVASFAATSALNGATGISVGGLPSGATWSVSGSSHCYGASGDCMKAGSWPAAWNASSSWLAWSVNTTGYSPTNFSVFLGNSASSGSNSMQLQYAGTPNGPFTPTGPLLVQTGNGPTFYNVSLPVDPVIANTVNASFRLVLVSAVELQVGRGETYST